MGPEGRQEANQEMNNIPAGRHQDFAGGSNRPSLDRPPLPENNRRNNVPRRFRGNQINNVNNINIPGNPANPGNNNNNNNH
jgi:hypothetical protein